MKPILLILTLLLTSLSLQAQTDFPAMKQQFLDYRKVNQQDSALYIARKMNQLALKEQSDTSYWYALSMRYQGNPHNTWGNIDSTIYYWQKSVDLFEKYHPKSPDYFKGIKFIGWMYFSKMNDYKTAEVYFKNFINQSKIVFGVDHPEHFENLNALTSYFILCSDYNSAEYYLKQVLEFKKKTLGDKHPDVLILLKKYWELHITMNNYAEAILLIEKYLNIKKKTVGEEHPEYAKGLMDLGKLYRDMGEYKTAEKIFKQSIEIIKNSLGDNRLDYASALNSLGVLYFIQMDDFKSAEPILKQVLEIKKDYFGENHIEVSKTLQDLALLYYGMGIYNSAESLTKRCLEITSIKSDQPYDSLAPLNQLGSIYMAIKDYKSALSIFKKSIKVLEDNVGEKHGLLSYGLHNLGQVYALMHDFTNADLIHKRALEIRRNIYGNEHKLISVSLQYLGFLYYEMKHYEEAVEYYKKVSEIKKKALGEEHPNYANSLDNLASLYTVMGDYKAAEPFHKQALDIYKKALGGDHPNFVRTENGYAELLTLTDRESEAYEILNKNFAKQSKQIAENFEWLNDNQKEAYWKKESSFYDKLSWFASKAYTKVPEAVALNFNGALITKSKLLETKISKENYYIEVDEIREELSYRKKLLNKLESDGSDKRKLMDKLRHEADSLDKQLELSWPAYAEQKRNLLITWDKVHQNLSNGEVAIEFVRFREDEDSAYQYQALIIRKDLELPVLAPLCMEEALLDIEPNAGFSAYYPLVWEPMEEHLKDIHTIYYAPSGELYNVPFHAIYAPKSSGDQEIAAKRNKRGEILTDPETQSEEDAEFLMDRYTLHQLTSTRYLALGLKKKEKEKPETSIAMVGGVNYDYLPGDENNKAKKSKKSKKSDNRSSASASGKLAYLEGTQKETESINTTTEANNWETTYLEGNNAKEESLTQFTDKEAKGILHIATHGYAFPEYSSLDTTIKENSLRYSYRFSQNPMVRSGLILAGGNWAWTGSDTLDRLGAEENGILTALEVSGLNLRNTKLVVLSACETGLGKIEGSEGTFGLKRGFKLAGVEQMIVSLWSVPDKETMELMTIFYEDLTQSLNPVTSFEKAQKQMRETYPTRPDLWAGFVLVR
ncbi:CHAT domain-containing protein [Crocinitomicaceae bacterium]|nr:CHAT domain-containing protein [Crocinitomicaceae bacterium]